MAPGNFSALPADIRANIFSRALRAKQIPPLAHVVTLTRTDVTEAFDDAEGRAALVNIDIDRDGLGRYSAKWRLNELAAVSRDTAEAVTKGMVRELGEAGAVEQASGGECNFLRLVRPNDLVIIKGPEEDPPIGYPFFACARNLRPVVLVSSKSEIDGYYGYYWTAGRSSTLSDICRALATVKHVALIYRWELDEDCPSYIGRTGLRYMKGNFTDPDVALYLVDELISLRPGVQAPPEGTLSFAGHGATFYVVNGNPAIWDFGPPTGNTLSVLDTAQDVEAIYGVPVRVLACIPHPWRA